MSFELTTRTKVILALGVPATGILLYLLLRNREDDENEAEQRNVSTSRQTVIEVKVPAKAVGAVIGRQGSNIKKLQEQTGTRINFKDDSVRREGEQRVLVIRGAVEKAQEAELLVRKTINEMPEIVTEEIQVPIRALGRIIGRNGDSIREISRSSKAKVYIDRARDEPRDTHKNVAITGSVQQISIAKGLIQEKVEEEEVFRAKAAVMAANREQRNKKGAGPNRQTTHVQSHEKLSNNQDLKMAEESSWQQSTNASIATHSMEWPDKEYVEIYVSSVADPHHFWVQLVTSMALQLDELVQKMSSLYNTDHYKEAPPMEQYSVGDYVAALYDQDNSWYRARVMGFEEGQLDLYFLDYGDSSYNDIDKVRPLGSEFLQLPFQAIHCCLGHIDVQGEQWTEEAISCFENLTYTAKWKVIMAKKITTNILDDGKIHVLELIDTNSPVDVDIGQEMVKRGFAIWDETYS